MHGPTPSEESSTKPNTAKPTARLLRMMWRVIAALYLATWIWGIPATHTGIARDVTGFYKSALQKHRGVGATHPELRFGASYAILPFVVVNHYEYRVARLWGWGGVELNIWYITGTKPVFWVCKWMS